MNAALMNALDPAQKWVLWKAEAVIGKFPGAFWLWIYFSELSWSPPIIRFEPPTASVFSSPLGIETQYGDKIVFSTKCMLASVFLYLPVRKTMILYRSRKDEAKLRG